MGSWYRVGPALVAACLVTSLAPPSAASEQELTLEEMAAEVAALKATFERENPEFVANVHATAGEVSVEALMTPILSPEEAGAWARDTVIYETTADEYASFLVSLYTLYRERGAVGLDALKALTGGEIAELVADGVIPSHEAYREFNLLAFYASLRDPSNEEWLLAQPKTTARADERLHEVLDGVTPQMREDAADLLGESMALAYERILRTNPEFAFAASNAADAVALPNAPAVDAARNVLSAQEEVALEAVGYALREVTPLAEDVKLTSMSQLTLVLNQITSLTTVYRELQNYYYELNYYYHYEQLERTWWYWLYVVDHVEQRDIVEYQILTENTYKLIEYLYSYQDVMTVQGLVSGVIGLSYEKTSIVGVEPSPVGGGTGHEFIEEPDQVWILLDYVLPIVFDVTDEAGLYVLEEIVESLTTTVRNEVHHFWEYHIRNYWYWDPLDDSSLPFQNAALNTLEDYVVTVSENLDVGAVLNVIPIRNMFREASLTLTVPTEEYPLLAKAVALSPAPVSFVPDQIAPGATAGRYAQSLHLGPAPNYLEPDASAARLTDAALAIGDGLAADATSDYESIVAYADAVRSDLSQLYSILPEEIQIDTPSLGSPSVDVPDRVDAGVDADQIVAWQAEALPSFIPQFAFAGVRIVEGVDAGRPILVNVNARGLGAPVTLAVDLTAGVLATAESELADAGVEVPSVGAPTGPLGEYAGTTADWAVGTVEWIRDWL